MADNKQPNQKPNDAKGIDTRQTPSQAEGGRETVEQDLEEKFGRSPENARPSDTGGNSLSTPSQAEGDRDTIDDDLDEKLK